MTIVQLIKWSIHMEIYQLRLRPSDNTIAIMHNCGANKINYDKTT